MNTGLQDERLRDLVISTYPAADPSDDFKSRIQTETFRRNEIQTRHVRWQKRTRLAMIWAGAVALAVIFVMGWPTLVAAQTLHRMDLAVSQVRQMHCITWAIKPDGSREKLRQLWTQGGQARLELPGRIELFNRGNLYSYVPAAKRVLVKSQESNPFFQTSDLSIGAMVHSVLLSGHPERIQQLDNIKVEGQTLKRVAIILDLGGKTIGTRSVLYAEAESDLPVRCDNQRLTQTGWLTEQTIEVQYNELQSVDFFAPHYPRDVQLIDAATEQQQWRRALTQEIGRVQTAEGTIIIRDLQVSAQGDVFLLTSGGNFGGPNMAYITHKDKPRTAIMRPSPLELTDDRGTRYLQQFNFGGQPDVQRWTPLTPSPGPWQARRFTVTFRSAEFYVVSSHPKPSTIWMHYVVRPQSAVMPDYLPNVNPSLYWDETRIQADAAAARAEALRVSSRQEDLERALVEYRNVIRIEDDGARQSGGVAVHPEAWFGIYRVLRDLGRSGEARQALQQAQDQDVYHNMTKEITEARHLIGQDE